MNPITQSSPDLASVGLSISGAATTIPRVDEFFDNLPPDFQFPVEAVVRVTFYAAGTKQPLAFPEQED